MMPDPDRPVGYESRKAYRRRCEEGFWDRYVAGPVVLDIGYRGVLADALPIVPGAIGFEVDGHGYNIDTPPYILDHMRRNLELCGGRYDGLRLPFWDGTVDCVHSSHVLEHLTGAPVFLREWFRVLRVGGTMILFVPHAYLYERRLSVPPSRWSGEHLRSYTPASLLAEVERALEPNSYRVEHLADADDGYDYTLPNEVHPTGCLEIELVLRKRETPAWKVEP